MAGLSSVMAITRPLGEVDLAAMNRCTGVYRVYLIGGGGGGGGYYDFQMWYGGAGSMGEEKTYDVSLIPPVTLSVGAGGSAGVGDTATGELGGATSMSDSRVSGIISASGGTGGISAYARKSLTPATVDGRIAKVSTRFTVRFAPPLPEPPYFTVTAGNGGGSMQSGHDGGIIKAFRIG